MTIGKEDKKHREKCEFSYKRLVRGMMLRIKFGLFTCLSQYKHVMQKLTDNVTIDCQLPLVQGFYRCIKRLRYVSIKYNHFVSLHLCLKYLKIIIMLSKSCCQH